MRTLFEIVLLVCSVELISPGCAPTIHKFSRDMPEEEQANNDAAFKRDVNECQRFITYQSNFEAMLGTAHVMHFERDMIRCLGARGWRQTPNGDYAYNFDAWIIEEAIVK